MMIDRYSLPPMKEMWTLESQYERWLEVELAALSAMEELGEVPHGTYADVYDKVHVDVDRIAAIEAEIRHDLLAFIRSLEEQAGDVGRFIHRGLTSSDVKDTTLSLQMRAGLDLILDEACALGTILLDKAREYQDLIIVGRTHGMHAEPTTLGLKFLLWKTELDRDIERLKLARESIGVGKLSGPVGTYTQVSPQVEEIACAKLGLRPARVANQVLQRDRHAEVLAAIAITAASLEKIALEIRSLSRTEVSEVEEPTPEGSSSMPHKRNPITSERICGLSRVLRSNLQAALENVALWHERDMSHSSVERLIIPDSFTLLHYMLVKMRAIIGDLVVHKDVIARNLGLTRGAIYSQAILIALVEEGMPRNEAHEAIRTASTDAFAQGRPLIDLLREDEKIASLLAAAKIDEGAILDRVRATSHRLIERESRG
ncbi:MAG: adenylosuccinate lyase [Candidatus Bipolaricaulota bacterium]|nr:adenylosuccinate lyase [Candidatus Bipolaricaulota bacterium]